MRKIFAALIAVVLIAPAAAFAHGNKSPSMFDQIDANHDGFVTKDEVNAYHEKMFDKRDANHDGKISKAEWKAGAKKQWQKKQGVNTTADDKANATAQ